MNIWEWLGIPPTTDIPKIKSAYARQAKLYHPEEHPEEFKALQNAYKMAVRMAKSQGTASYETSADISERDAKEEESEKQEKSEKTEQNEKQGQIPEPDTEYSFDFSGIDSYGDREQFFQQFLLVVQNPYLCNNLTAWTFFLERKEFIDLFAATDFRMKFVHTMCSQRGLRRKTILFFERYLNKFHAEENKPADGKWETELPCFRIRKIPRLGLPAFCTDRFLGGDGAAFHKKLCSQISRAQGRELSLEVESDLIKYMRLYLSSGKAMESDIKRFYRDWIVKKTLLNSIVFAGCLFALLASVYSAERKNERESRISYLMELYGLEEDSYSDEEKEELLNDYSRSWKYAEEAIDEALNRYERW